MIQKKWLRTLACGVLACCVTLPVNSSLVRGADAPAKESKEKESKEKGKSRGRLPPFYNKIVDKEQREAIYKIQEKHAAQIEELEKQLQAAEDKRDAEIAAVLTAEQREKVAALVAESKAKSAEAKKKTATAAPGTTAAAPEGK